MQLWRLTVKTRKVWSRRINRRASGPRRAAIDFVLLCLVFGGLTVSVGCAEPEPHEASSVESSAADESAGSGAVDSLISEGDRSVAQKISDASVAAEVQIALMDDRDLRAFRLEPVVVNGRVVLQGEVETADQRRRAESLASDVASVREVINRITSVEQPVLAEVRGEDDTAERRAEDVAAPEASDGAAPSEPGLEASASSATYHTVEYGDNLWDIARAYDVSVEQITRLNDLGSNSIKPGQRLQIK